MRFPALHPRAQPDQTVPANGSAELRAMWLDARKLADRVGSPDHWAKPFYSSAATFVAPAPRAFIGLNGAGDRFAHQYDIDDGNDDRIWSEPLYNAFLDDRWGDGRKVYAPGTHSHQRAIQTVFRAMYRDAWESVLRGSACFNIMPVSSRGQSDPLVAHVWLDGLRWGTELLAYLRPRLVILNGNGETGRSAWSAIHAAFGIRETIAPIPLENPFFRLREGSIMSGPASGTRVIGLPHLSRNKASAALIRGLEDFRPFE